MFFTQFFASDAAKVSAVKDNTVAMIVHYFLAYVPHPSTDDLVLTNAIVTEWVEDNYHTATMTDISDFVARLVDDYNENLIEHPKGA